MIDSAILQGKNPCNIDFDTMEAPFHQEAVAAFLTLQKKARQQGYDLAVASSYRDYERQLAIWNGKLKGLRPVYGSDNQLLNLASMSAWEQVQAVLRWSALPGASRHHWGTDIDVYDRAAVAQDYKVQLSLDEVTQGGPFAPLHHWLDGVLETSVELGFFRPYDIDRGGVAPERWHLSYAPIAALYQQQLTIETLVACIEQSEMLLKETVINHIEEIYHRYIAVPIDAYPVFCQHLFN